MEESNKIFVETNLSDKSSSYIINDLFENKDLMNIIEAEMLLIKKSHEGKIFILDSFSDVEFELYIIMEFLYKGLRGARRRLNRMYVDKNDNRSISLVNEKFKRVSELESDWKKTKTHLNELIELNHQAQILKTLKNHPELLKERFKWSDYKKLSGYEFVFLRERIIGIANHYEIRCKNLFN